jgi:hypothetical protein
VAERRSLDGQLATRLSGIHIEASAAGDPPWKPVTRHVETRVANESVEVGSAEEKNKRAQPELVDCNAPLCSRGTTFGRVRSTLVAGVASPAVAGSDVT